MRECLDENSIKVSLDAMSVREYSALSARVTFLNVSKLGMLFHSDSRVYMVPLFLRELYCKVMDCLLLFEACTSFELCVVYQRA